MRGTGVNALAASESSKIREVCEFWQNCAGNRRFPAWPDVDLMQIYSVAPYVGVIDVENIDGIRRFRYRFLGTKLVQSRASLTVADPTGRLVDEVDHYGLTTELVARYVDVVDSGDPMLLGDTVNPAEIFRVSERGIMPLGPDDRTVDKLLICIERLPYGGGTGGEV